MKAEAKESNGLVDRDKRYSSVVIFDFFARKDTNDSIPGKKGLKRFKEWHFRVVHNVTDVIQELKPAGECKCLIFVKIIIFERNQPFF